MFIVCVRVNKHKQNEHRMGILWCSLFDERLHLISVFLCFSSGNHSTTYCPLAHTHRHIYTCLFYGIAVSNFAYKSSNTHTHTRPVYGLSFARRELCFRNVQRRYSHDELYEFILFVTAFNMHYAHCTFANHCTTQTRTYIPCDHCIQTK